MSLSYCVPQCRERFVKGGRVTFHCFPRNLKRKLIWTDKVRETNPNFIPTADVRICSRHFEKVCFVEGFGGVWLNYGAVPTHFSPREAAKRPSNSTLLRKLREGRMNSSPENFNMPIDQCQKVEIKHEPLLVIKQEALDLDDGEAFAINNWEAKKTPEQNTEEMVWMPHNVKEETEYSAGDFEEGELPVKIEIKEEPEDFDDFQFDTGQFIENPFHSEAPGHSRPSHGVYDEGDEQLVNVIFSKAVKEESDPLAGPPFRRSSRIRTVMLPARAEIVQIVSQGIKEESDSLAEAPFRKKSRIRAVNQTATAKLISKSMEKKSASLAEPLCRRSSRIKAVRHPVKAETVFSQGIKEESDPVAESPFRRSSRLRAVYSPAKTEVVLSEVIKKESNSFAEPPVKKEDQLRAVNQTATAEIVQIVSQGIKEESDSLAEAPFRKKSRIRAVNQTATAEVVFSQGIKEKRGALAGTPFGKRSLLRVVNQTATAQMLGQLEYEKVEEETVERVEEEEEDQEVEMMRQSRIWTDVGLVVYECPHCAKIFAYPSHMKRHFSTCFYFQRLRAHKCYECGSIFKSASGLAKHKQIHLHLRQNWYICEHCRVTFKGKNCYRKHLNTHIAPRYRS